MAEKPRNIVRVLLPGVIDRNVGTSEFIYHFGNHFLACRLVTKIGSDGKGVAAVTFDNISSFSAPSCLPDFAAGRRFAFASK